MADSNMGGERRYPPAAVAWYSTIILALTYLFSFLDRQALILLIEPIRASLKLTDTGVSLLTGAAFVICYSIAAIPLAMLADRHGRRRTIILGVVIWGSMTMACGLANSFVSLAVFRMGVGFGEAALVTSAYATITEIFPPRTRGKALAVMALGGAAGAGMAFVAGAFAISLLDQTGGIVAPIVGRLVPWQMVMIALGALTLIMVLPLLFIADRGIRSSNSQASRVQIVSHLWRRRRGLAAHFLGISFLNIIMYAALTWTPSVLIRVHHWSSVNAGYSLGVAGIIASTLGVLTSGWLGDALKPDVNPGALLKVVVGGSVLATLSLAIVAASPSGPIVVAGFFVAIFSMASLSVLAPLSLQLVATSNERAQTSAFFLLIANLMGMGVGPTAVAIITDKWFGDTTMVGWSVFIVCAAASLIGGTIVLRTLRSFVSLCKATAAEEAAMLRASQA